MPTNVQCPECEKEVQLTDDGECPNCHLNVARVLAHDRHERALQKMREKRKADEKPPKKEGFFDSFF